jgi:PAS domain S-box-containing protein
MAARSRKKSVHPALLRRLKLVRGLYARAPEAMIITVPSARIDCNAAALRLFGYRSKADFLAVRRGGNAPLRQPDGRRSTTAARAYYQQAVRSGYAKFEWQFRRRDGGEFLAEVVLAAFTLEGHRLIRAAIRDLTDERRARAALEASARSFREVAELHPVPVVVNSAREPRVLYANKAAAELYGMTQAQLLRRPVDEFWADLGERTKLAREAYGKGSVREEVVSQRRADGSVFWLATSIQPIVYEGTPAWICAVRDLTAQRQAEAERAASEARFRSLAEAHPVPLAVTSSTADKFLYVSDAAAKLYRLPRETLMRRRPSSFWAVSGDRLRGRDLLLNGGQIDDFRTRMRRGDGSVYPASVSGRMIEFDGEPAFFAAIRDMTEELAAAAALRDSEERFRELVGLHPVPLTIFDRDYRGYFFVSPAYAELMGMSVEQIMASRPGLLWADREDARRAEAHIRRHGRMEGYEARMRRPDGSDLWIAVTMRAVRYQGKPSWICALVDITARKAMDAALRDSEERFRQIAELHPVPMVINDRAWTRYMYVSPAAARMLRTSTEDMLNMSPASFWPDPAAMQAAGDVLFQRGSLDDYEARLRRVDGEEVWIAATVRPIQYDGQPAWLNALVDVTARKQAESALRDSEERFRAMAEAAPVAIAVHSAHRSRMLYVNQAFAKIYMTTREDLLSRPLADGWVDQGDRLRLREWLIKEGQVDEFTALHKRADGSHFYAALSARPMIYQGQHCFVSTLRDLTAQYAAEAAVRDSEWRFRELLELHPSPMVVTSGVEDRILYVSKAGERLLGMPSDEILAKPASWFWADPRDREQVLAGGVIDELEVKLRRAGGQEYWASLSGRVFDYDGKPALFMTGRDLTQQKETEAEIERQRAALEQSAKMAAMGSLLASVSHELNNPLAVVMAQAELLRELTSGTPVAERAETIHSAAERCAHIVRTFLALARQKPPVARGYNLNDVARAAVELLGYGLKSAGIQVRLDLAEDLPTLHGDADQMAQVLSNLLLNAQQAMQQRAGQRRLVVATRRWQRQTGAPARHRFRTRRAGGDPHPHLRAVLHHQADRHRHRHRPRALP